jgi:hypothetical protein
VEPADRKEKKISRRRPSRGAKPTAELEPRHAAASLKIPAEESAHLPESYGQTGVKLLPVHPGLLYAYWEVTPGDLKAAGENVIGEKKPHAAILRFYDESVVETTRAFDVEVSLEATNWYVPLGSSAPSYRAELGVEDESGHFTVLARSDVVHPPPALPSTNVDAHFGLAGIHHRPEELHAEQGRSAQDLTQQPVNMAEAVHGTLSRLYSELGEQGREFVLQAEAKQPGIEIRPAPGSHRPTEERLHSHGTERDVAKQAIEASKPEPPETPSRLPDPVDMSEEVRRQLSEMYGPQNLKERPRETQDSSEPAPQTPPAIDQKPDLTELNERSFTSGVPSSRR